MFRERRVMGERGDEPPACRPAGRTWKGVVMGDSLPRLVTVGVIASELGVPVERVCRILRARPRIRPRAVAGNVRLFDNAAIGAVRYELNVLDARRKARMVQHG